MKKIKGNVAYYSHPRSLYNTSIEKKVLKNINKIFKGTVICPNNNIGDLNDPRDYLTISGKADVIFVSPSPEHEGYLSNGCFKEVENALNNNIPVFMIKIKKVHFMLTLYICRIHQLPKCKFSFHC
jgi:hypothetical protein